MAHEVRHTKETRTSSSEKSLGELFAELSRETSELVRQEVTLAKTELTQKASEAGKDVGFLAAGGFVAYAGFLALLAALIIGLGQLGVTWWLSAFVVGLVVAAVGGYLVMKGIDDLKSMSMAPQHTLQTLKEDTQWAKEQTK